MRAAKVIARLESLGFNTGARKFLDRWADHEDSAVCAEARQQVAVLQLYDALLQEDLVGIRSGLTEARVAFTRAERSEEERVDAKLFLALINLLLAYLEPLSSGDADASALRTQAQGLAALIANPMGRPWYGYASGPEALLEYRIYRIADGFTHIASAMLDAEEWTKLDEALIELSAVLRLMWDAGEAEQEGLAGSLGALEAGVVVPRLGPFLDRAVGRARFRRVIANHESRHGTDSHAVFLRHLHEAALQSEYAGSTPQDAAVLAQLSREVEASPPERLLLPIDHPGCYGNDPNVDETVRPLLKVARERLGADYPHAKWRKFVDVVVYIVQIARDIRDFLPDFALCAEEEGGKGQGAGESDLQEYVFQQLRLRYGRDALYEPQRIGGGRGDCGVRTAECEIPIEVKAEYRDVSRDHVQANYIGQVDEYATARDRLALLLILDARAENSARHRARRRAARKAGHLDTLGVKLYSLREAFWITGLPVDPQISGARENVVVVGLVPGNRAKPSSTTTYSKRPTRT